MVAERETAGLAGRRLPEARCPAPRAHPPFDRGSPMTGKCTAQLLADLGVHTVGAVPGSRTTTRTRRRSSRRSSTTRASPAASAASRMRRTSAATSSRGTTPHRHGGRTAHPRPGPLRPRARGDPAKAGGARRRLRRPPRPLRRGPAQRGGTRREVWINRPIPVSAVDGREAAAEGSGVRKGGLAKLICEMSQNR